MLCALMHPHAITDAELCADNKPDGPFRLKLTEQRPCIVSKKLDSPDLRTVFHLTSVYFKGAWAQRR